MKNTLPIALGASLLWAVIAFVIDRYALVPVWPWASKIATIKFQFFWPLGHVNFPRMGLLVLFGIPLLALAIFCVPRRDFGNRAVWGEGFQLWSRSIVWLIVWCVLIFVGQVFYLVLQKYLPDGLCKFAETFEIHGAVKVFDFEFAELKGSLSALLGLLAGAYFFLSKGLNDTLRMVFTKSGQSK